MPKKKKKEIVVPTSYIFATPSKETAKKIAERALEEERMTVLEVSHRVAVRFGVLALVTGTLLIVLWAYVTVTGKMNWVTTSPNMTKLFFAALAFVGIISIVGGLLLMGRGR